MFGNLFSKPEPVTIDENSVLVDVRSPAEFMQGHPKKALNWPLDQLTDILQKNGKLKSKPVVLYCASGARAGVALSMMNRAGFSNVVNVGGIGAVVHLGLE